MCRKVVVASASVVALLVGGVGGPAYGQDDEGEALDFEVEAGNLQVVSEEESPVAEAPGGGSGGSGPSSAPEPDPDAPVCSWVTLDDNEDLHDLWLWNASSRLDPGARPSGDHQLQYLSCSQELPREDGTTSWTEDVRWMDPNADPADDGPSGAELGEALYARLAGSLPTPEISTNPALGRAWFVNAPVFVSIDNWEDDEDWDGTFTDQECDPDDPEFCAYVEAHPVMVFDPGDGTGDIGCEPPGVLFSGTTNDEVFALHESPASCSHVYELRSGVGDRPEEWPGEVCIVWTIDWWDDDGGEGTYEDPTRHCADLPREINSVTTVVTD